MFHLVQFLKCWQLFLELNSKRVNRSSRKEKEVFVLCSRTPQNVKLVTSTLYSCSDGKEMYKKSRKHVQSCCLLLI